MYTKGAKPARRLLILIVLAAALLGAVTLSTQLQAVTAQEQQPMELLWADDFESYVPGPSFPENFPNPPWIHSGYPDAFVYTDHSVSGAQSLKMVGLYGDCAGSVAYRYIGGYIGAAQPLEIVGHIRNGSGELSGCHQKYGGMELSTAPDWTTEQRGLIAFSYENVGGTEVREIWGGAFEVDETDYLILQPYNAAQWYEVKIRYEWIAGNQVKLTFWIDGVLRGEKVYPRLPYEGSLSYLGLWSGEGFAWHDDVALYGNPVVWPERLFLSKIHG